MYSDFAKAISSMKKKKKKMKMESVPVDSVLLAFARGKPAHLPRRFLPPIPSSEVRSSLCSIKLGHAQDHVLLTLRLVTRKD